jgi:methionyl-tRNA synthetase
MEITIDYFNKLELVVGKVLSAEEVPNSNKLIKLTIDIGDKTITVLSGIKKWRKPEQILNKKLIVLKNIKPAKMAGMLSEGMILAAEKDEKLSLLTVDEDIDSGAIVH